MVTFGFEFGMCERITDALDRTFVQLKVVLQKNPENFSKKCASALWLSLLPVKAPRLRPSGEQERP
jgi:hypothetical protein